MPPVALKDSPSQAEMAVKSPILNGFAARPRIVDIRREKLDLSLEDEILKGLVGKTEGEKSLPTLLLYSEEGLKLFEEITYLDEYYPTNTEIEVLEKWSASIAERIEDGSILVELGSGNLRKVNILLKNLDQLGKKIDYYALDLDKKELNRTLSLIETTSFKNIRFFGLHGTYEDGRAWLKTSPEVKDRPRCVLWLGSSAGNFERSAAAEFIKNFSEDALRPGKPDYMLIGLDGCKDGEKVYTAYNDPQGVTDRFIKCGLTAANSILDGNYFDLNEWEYHGEWNTEHGRHQAYLVPKNTVRFDGKLEGVSVKAGERVHIEYSYKFDSQDAQLLWEESGLIEGAQWSNEKGDYFLHLLNKPTFNFELNPNDYFPEKTPKLSEWQDLWASWDTVTLGMIPREQLTSKPIDLRNPCIFYLGHIPTFLDNLLTRGINESEGKATATLTEPASYLEIFQRGIDPDVDSPDICHSHSAIPATWPELQDVLDYEAKVRKRLTDLYKNGSASHQAEFLQRAIWTGFEHEVMHLETLLYMLIQADTTLPPPSAIKPDFVSGRSWERRKSAPAGNEWVKIPKMELTVGMDDLEGQHSNVFGWDNEKPSRKVTVDEFTTRAYPITNEEYGNFLRAHPKESIPALWTTKDGEKKNDLSNVFVRTFFGLVPLTLVPDWPVIASYDELALYAKWIGGRIPTAEEVHAIYDTVDLSTVAENQLSGKIDAVNGHLVNNGVCETPPLFSNLSGRNVGFKNWHPTSVRSRGSRLLGRGETGGAWEWTSTTLEKHPGFKPSTLYPEYTADFFDGKHNIVLGGSWATHPRVAGRRSFVNWYQRNYRYMWATARIVKEV
ncbi:C-type lectin protein [Geopyxis carbonaria]|nr:C-type lectin protein [Geopyxis carbonaria]